MAEVEQNVTNFPIGIGPIPASAKNAQKAEVWAEGTDEQVEELGGTHSAKGWATSAAGYASDPNIVACGTNISSINEVAGNVSNVNTVAGINGAVSVVSGISNDVSTVAGKKEDISTCAANISDISEAPASASSAAASATAASNSATNAQKWAEGADSAVTHMGGTHSAKGWAEQAQAIVSSLGTVLHYKGSVDNYAALQAVTGQIVGDVYNVTDTGDNYAWDGSAWDKLSGTVDLSAYRTASAQDVIDSGKQATLVSGTNIKTVNNTSLLGSGDITIDSLPSQTGQSGKFLTTDGSSASWGEVSVPSNVWTSDNLKAGNNISITQVQQPVIDENTVALWHFDNQTNLNVISNDAAYSVASYGAGRFGYTNDNGAMRSAGAGNFSLIPSGFSSAFNTNKNFAIDFWWKRTDGATSNYQSYLSFSNSSGNTWYDYGIRIDPGANPAHIDIYGGYSQEVVASSGTLSSLLDLNWHHIAFQHDYTASELRCYLDGSIVSTKTNLTITNWNNPKLWINGGGSTVDELRISNTLRYTSDFTPFTEPYSESASSVSFVINNTLDISSKQDLLTTITGYDASKQQTLQNDNGTLKWVDNA